MTGKPKAFYPASARKAKTDRYHPQNLHTNF